MPRSLPLLTSSHPSTSMSLPIVAIAILGILTTSIFLLTYYIFVIKCCLNRRRSDLLLRLFSATRGHSIHSPAPTESTGLDLSTIRAIPTFRYPSIPAAASECAVCLSEFRGEERLRLLPVCAHAFHIDCIDTWLQSNTSCPLCRAHITYSFPPPMDDGLIPAQNSAIEVGDAALGNQRRKLGHAVSMGDECIEVRRDKDESFAVQSLRRSLSMDSSCHRQLYISVQEILRKNPGMLCGEGSSGNGGGGGEGGGVEGSGRVRRSFFPFSYGRSSRSAIQPVDMAV